MCLIALQHGDNDAYHEIGVRSPRLGVSLNVNTTFSPCVLSLHGFVITVQCGYKIKARGEKTCHAFMPRKGRRKALCSVCQANNQKSGSVSKCPTLERMVSALLRNHQPKYKHDGGLNAFRERAKGILGTPSERGRTLREALRV